MLFSLRSMLTTCTHLFAPLEVIEQGWKRVSHRNTIANDTNESNSQTRNNLTLNYAKQTPLAAPGAILTPPRRHSRLLRLCALSFVVASSVTSVKVFLSWRIVGGHRAGLLGCGAADDWDC